MTILRIRRPAGLLGYSNKPAVILLYKNLYICMESGKVWEALLPPLVPFLTDIPFFVCLYW